MPCITKKITSRYEFNMDETFQAFHNVLCMAGISIFAKHSWSSRSWLALQLFNVFIGSMTIVFTTGFVIDNINDLPIFIDGACIWTTGVIMFISLCICLMFRNKLRMFLDEMVFKDGMQDVPFIDFISKFENGGKLSAELKTLVRESQEKLLKLTRILLKTYVISVFVTATLYLCGAVFQMIVREDTSKRILAFDMWFPWSLEDFRVYTASFIIHAYAGYLCCVAYPGFQSTIILLVGQIIRQLKILTFILSNLDPLVLEITKSGRDENWQTYCTDVLSQCVRHYVKLKRFCNRLNKICQPFYLALILDAIMLVCVCSVKIAISNKLSLEVIKYYIHELCFIIVVLMFCTLGQQVHNECEKLEEAIFERWFIFDAKHQKHLRIFKIAVSQRMPTFIFGTITLSLPTFTWFIRTGMSFFTLMMSFLEEE